MPAPTGPARAATSGAEPPGKPQSPKGEITLVAALSPRYFPHIERHLKSLSKIHGEVTLLYWEKNREEPLYRLPGIRSERVVFPFGKGGILFFTRVMAAFLIKLLELRPRAVEAIDPYALIPCRLVALLFPCRIHYFSLEYFSEQPSLRNKPFKRRAWKHLERWGAKGARRVATVCDSIAGHLRDDFGKESVITVRNMPERGNAPVNYRGALHKACGLPAGTRIVLYQGMLQEGRGLEGAVAALSHLPWMHLAVAGTGPLFAGLLALARGRDCSERLHMLGEVDAQELKLLTPGAFAGLAPFQPLSPSYLYSLPGKMFEYIQAEVPVVATALPEIAKIVEGYHIGYCMPVADSGPRALADILQAMADDPEGYAGMKENLRRAREELCWEAEEEAYLSLFRD